MLPSQSDVGCRPSCMQVASPVKNDVVSRMDVCLHADVITSSWQSILESLFRCCRMTTTTHALRVSDVRGHSLSIVFKGVVAIRGPGLFISPWLVHFTDCVSVRLRHRLILRLEPILRHGCLLDPVTPTDVLLQGSSRRRPRAVSFWFA